MFDLALSAHVVAAAAFAVVAPPPELVVNGDLETRTLEGVNSDHVHTPNGNSDEGTATTRHRPA